MKRTNISMHTEVENIVVEFDEEYQAGRLVNVKSHYLEKFTNSDTIGKHATILSNVGAPGFFGFFYRNFGKSRTGKANLKSYKTYFEKKI